MPTRPTLQDTALDHLRVIRTLMERASLYRAVSAPAALAGGVLSLGTAIFGLACARGLTSGVFQSSRIPSFRLPSAR